MRLFHIADLHLGKTLHAWDLLEDQAFILDGIVAKIGEMKPEVLLVAGDIYDRAIPPVEAIRLFDHFLGAARQAAPGLQIVVVPGNHDSAGRLSFGASLLADSGLHIAARVAMTRTSVMPTVARQTAARPVLDAVAGEAGEGKERFAIWALPFLTQSSAEWEELDEVGSGPAIRSQQEMMRLAIRAIRRAMDPGVTNILIAHCFTSGAFAGDSELAFVGAAEQVDVTLFDGFDYVALGHLHSRQSPAPRVWYSGAPLAYSMPDASREAGQGFMAVDVAMGGVPRVEFVPLVPKRRLRKLSGLFDELLAKPLPEDERDDFIEVHILDEEAVLNAAERLRVIYPHLLGATQQAFELRWGAAGAESGFAGALGAGSAGMEALRRARGAGNAVDRVDTAKSDFLAFYGEMMGQAPGEAMERLFESMAREASDASD